MAHFLLVHGAWHNESCWHLLKPILEERGHRVTTITLPGHRDGERNRLFRRSMSRYVKAVTAAVDAINEPVICVGHSMAGYIIAAAAEKSPSIFKKMIFLTAFVPDGKRGMMDVVFYHWKTHINVWKTRFLIFWSGTNVLPRELAREWLYHDCPRDVQDAALDKLVPQPIGPFYSRVNVSRAKFGSTAKSYIECTLDQMVPHEIQKSMRLKWHFDRIVRLPSSHSPFLSMPEKTADVLEELAD